MPRAILVLALLALSASAFAQPQWQIGKPIVTYYAGPDMTAATARQMAEGNLNLVWCTEAQLDNVQQAGLRGMLRDGLLTPSVLDDPAQRAKLDALIGRVKSHPALYAYYLIDEPNASQFPAFGKLVAYLREKDPARLAYLNLFPTYASNEQLGNRGDVATAYTEHLQQFVEVVKPQLISYDHYHFTLRGDTGQYFLNLALVREAALKANIPFLNIVQACTWAPDSMRIPHTNEVRWLVNTSLAYGAQGISYYVYCHPGHYGALATLEGQPTPLYYGLRQVNRDFEAIAGELQPLHSLGAYHCGTKSLGAQLLPSGAPFRLDPPVVAKEPEPLKPTEGFVLGYFGPKAGRPTHVVVVNLDYSNSVETTLVGPAALRTFNPATGRWTFAGSSKVHLRLRPGGCRLVGLAQ